MHDYSRLGHILSLSLIFIFGILLQTKSYSQVQGLKAGLNLSSISAEGDSQILPAYYVGIVAVKKLSEHLNLKNEFVYSLQGAKTNANSGVRYHYLNVPLLLSFTGKKFTLDTGPQVGFLVNAVAKVGSDKRNVTSALNTFDLSYCLGGAYTITTAIAIEARFNIGLTTNSRHLSGITNQVLQFGLRYTFKKRADEE
jgi:hypothetical protein